MNHGIGLALGMVALSAAFAAVPTSSAIGQSREYHGDRYGLGVEGTIGRGTSTYGPADPVEFADSALRGSFRTAAPAAGNTSASAAVTRRPVARPYSTSRYYEPGDGYRYPLYYDPANRGYVYYPVRRPQPPTLSYRRAAR